MTLTLKGKVAAVTGGATGIGRAIAHRLATAGAQVALGGRRHDKLAEAAKSFNGTPAIVTLDCDVTNRESVRRFFSWLVHQFGKIDILVNGAAQTFPIAPSPTWSPISGTSFWQSMPPERTTAPTPCFLPCATAAKG